MNLDKFLRCEFNVYNPPSFRTQSRLTRIVSKLSESCFAIFKFLKRTKKPPDGGLKHWLSKPICRFMYSFDNHQEKLDVEVL